MSSRLVGMSYRQVVKKLRRLGVEFKRQGRGSHEIWWIPQTQRVCLIPNNGKPIKAGLMHGILRDLGVTPELFLAS